MKWTDHITVRSSETDIDGIASASAVLRWLQDAAANQHYFMGPSLDELRAGGRAYVLSRFAMRLYAPVRTYDELTVNTWACPGTGVVFYRCGSIDRGDEHIAELSTTWAMLDTATRAFVKQSDVEYGFGTDEPIEVGAPLRFPAPGADAPIIGLRTVRYSDGDENGHMNNTVYPDMFCDFLPELSGAELPELALGMHPEHCPHLYRRRVSEISVAYLREARIGEELTVHRSDRDGSEYLFSAVGSDGKPRANARIVTVEL